MWEPGGTKLQNPYAGIWLDPTQKEEWSPVVFEAETCAIQYIMFSRIPEKTLTQ